MTIEEYCNEVCKGEFLNQDNLLERFTEREDQIRLAERNRFLKIIDTVRGYNYGVCDANFILDVIESNLK